MRRVLPVCLLFYWGAFFAYRAVGIAPRWWNDGDQVTVASALLCILAFGELAIGFCGFMGASLVLFPDKDIPHIDRRLLSAVGLAAVIFAMLDWGLSAFLAGSAGLPPAIPPALTLSVIALAHMIGGSPALANPPQAANDNAGAQRPIGLSARLANLAWGRGAGS